MTAILGLALPVWALPSACAEITEALPPGFPTRRGAFAFTDVAVLARPNEHRDAIGWLAHFDVLLTNGVGIADEQTRSSLQAQGCRLFLYFWTNAIYEGAHSVDPPHGDWCEEFVTRPSDHLLSPEPLPSLAGRPAHYFDLASESVRSRLCDELAAARAVTGYDGIFFDYAGEHGLPPEVLELWQARHPGLPYDRAVAALLALLRERDPDCLIFTNQAFGSEEPISAEADYDLAESYATSHAWGPETEVAGEMIPETHFRPWPGQFGIDGMYRACLESVRRTPPLRALFFLDYARPHYRRAEDGTVATSLDLEAVYYSYCAAALWGRHSFCSGWYSGHEYRGPLYFADIGEPLGEAPEELDGVVLREYKRGLVVLTTGVEPVEVEYELRAGGRMPLYDLFASVWIEKQGGAHHLRLAPSRGGVSGTGHPVGRVYLKARR